MGQLKGNDIGRQRSIGGSDRLRFGETQAKLPVPKHVGRPVAMGTEPHRLHKAGCRRFLSFGSGSGPEASLATGGQQCDLQPPSR